MNIKKLTLGILAGATMVVAPTQAQAQFDKRTIEQIAMLLLAERLGIDPYLIMASQQRAGGSIYDMAPVYAMQRYVPTRSADSIAEMRRRGMGWGEIANSIGMHPGEFNKLRNSGQLDPNYWWRSTSTQGLRINQSAVDKMRRLGYNWSDIQTAALISSEANRSIWDVEARYRAYRDWNRVAASFGITNARVQPRIANWQKTRTMPTQWQRVVYVEPVKVKSSSSNSSKNAKNAKNSKNNGKGKGKSKGRG